MDTLLLLIALLQCSSHNIGYLTRFYEFTVHTLGLHYSFINV